MIAIQASLVECSTIVIFFGTPMSRSSTLCGFVLCCLSASLSADDTKEPAAADAPDPAEARIQALHESAKRFVIQMQADPAEELMLRDQPLFRWSNPISGFKYGIVSLWADQHGRPAVLAQVFLDGKETTMIHEFQSVAQQPLLMTRAGAALWKPAGPGIEMHPLPDAPAPPDGRTARSLQARRLAAQFKASVEFKLNPADAETSHYELRLRPRPVYEYGRDGEPLTYGALFTFDQGTNPEVWVLLEVHRAESGPEWRYALAPQTGYHVRAEHKSGIVWESPNQQSYRNRNDRPVFWINDPVVSNSP
jgi:hypothetical protein